MSLKSDNQRISFSSVKNRMHYPDFLEVQLKSFQDFFQLDTTAENRKNEGLYKVFMENFPIRGIISYWSSSTTMSIRPVTAWTSASSADSRTAYR